MEVASDEQRAQDAANCLRMTLRRLHSAIASVRTAHAEVDRWKREVDMANAELPVARQVSMVEVFAEALPIERSGFPGLSMEGAKTDALLLTVGAIVGR